MKLLAGNSNRGLARAVAEYLKIDLTKARIERFADLEVFVEIQENVRGQDVFILQSTSYPANDNLMELLISHRCPLSGLGLADHGGHPVFRLCAAGSQTGPAHADLGEARRQHDPRRRCGPRARA